MIKLELEKFSIRYTGTIESLKIGIKEQMKQVQEVVQENKRLRKVTQTEQDCKNMYKLLGGQQLVETSCKDE